MICLMTLENRSRFWQPFGLYHSTKPSGLRRKPQSLRLRSKKALHYLPPQRSTFARVSAQARRLYRVAAHLSPVAEH
ncbi:hypothetical protein PILCRDRAFT_820410 [Piloderma croceum F 1598]|uniref:Uncharacterized protein n=1 Tax=Piloderma croceum (strain F 1598) TaxID=765440 RepID=A0A0C3B8D3_PILCF|nr:hypothetical protein PILCRDRAFT_820410 [Piloderma croceum F 1598]